MTRLCWPFFAPRVVALACVLLLGACAGTGSYRVPEAPVPASYKEAAAAAQWLPAAPADTLDRGPWWSLFGDPELDRLAASVQVSNQNIAAAAAAYAQARALVKEQRAALFPVVSLGVGADRSGGRRRAETNSFSANLGAGWEVDLWGRIAQSIDVASANAQASEADLAAARLSIAAELASNYLSLRVADAQLELLQMTLAGYERSRQITQNRYAAGIIARTDVLQAQGQLSGARGDIAAARQSRARFEHAIAVLTGVAPGDFSLPVVPWKAVIPAVPSGVPSELLQRRPDVAAAERAVAAANAQVGVARTAFFPSLTLNGGLGSGGPSFADLARVSSAVWSLGLSVAQTVFDAGARKARVEGAEAARDRATAEYRQTVLTGFQDVEDRLSDAATLAEQEVQRKDASAAADAVEAQIMNRYNAGLINYTEVVTAQASALSARRSLLQIQADRQAAAIGLIQALGGGWQSPFAAATATNPAGTR